MAHRPPPTASEVDAARRVLGLRAGAGRPAVMSAWKAALRVRHPDAVEPRRREAAEEDTKRINSAKQILVEAIDRGFPNGVGAAPSRSHTTQGGPRRPRTERAPVAGRGASSGPAAAPTAATRSSPGERAGTVHVPVGPAWTPSESRWLLVVALVVAGLVAIAVVSLTHRSGSSSDSRIVASTTRPTEDSPVTPVPARPGPTADPAPAVALGAEPTAAAFLLAAHADPTGASWWEELVHPRARAHEVAQVVRELAEGGASAGSVLLASESITCDLGGGPGTGQSHCHVDRPSGLVSDLEFRLDGDDWKLAGMWRAS